MQLSKFEKLIVFDAVVKIQKNSEVVKIRKVFEKLGLKIFGKFFLSI